MEEEGLNLSSEKFRLKHIALAGVAPHGRALYIPQEGTGGGGEYGAPITDKDRLFAITREPAGHRIVFTVAHDVFDNWFELELLGKNITKEASEDFNNKIQKVLETLKVKHECNRMGVFERGFGWAIIVLNYEGTEDHSLELSTEEQGKKIVQVRAYGPPQISSIKEAKNPKDPRCGLPIEYRIKQRGIATKLKVHWTRTILFNTRDIGSHEWKTESVLDSVFDDLVTLRNERWSMGQTLFRYGPGFPDIEFLERENTDIEKFIQSGRFANLSARTFFAHTDKEKFDFKGAQGAALNPTPYYLPVLESISMGTGIPVPILRGAQAGALTGSEVNLKEYFKLVSDEQTAYESGIKELIKILYHNNVKTNETTDKAADQEEPEELEFKINWFSGFELTEREKADVALIEAQTLRVRGAWRTINELRKEEDPDDQGIGPEGDKLLGQQTIDLSKLTGSAYNVRINPDGSTTVIEIPKQRPPS